MQSLGWPIFIPTVQFEKKIRIRSHHVCHQLDCSSVGLFGVTFKVKQAIDWAWIVHWEIKNVTIFRRSEDMLLAHWGKLHKCQNICNGVSNNFKTFTSFANGKILKSHSQFSGAGLVHDHFLLTSSLPSPLLLDSRSRVMLQFLSWCVIMQGPLTLQGLIPISITTETRAWLSLAQNDCRWHRRWHPVQQTLIFSWIGSCKRSANYKLITCNRYTYLITFWQRSFRLSWMRCLMVVLFCLGLVIGLRYSCWESSDISPSTWVGEFWNTSLDKVVVFPATLAECQGWGICLPTIFLHMSSWRDY